MLLRVFLCISCLSFCLYSSIDWQNEVTLRRLQIPVLAQEIKELKEANTRLQYEIDFFESPEHLIELARQSEFSYLKYPTASDIVLIQEAVAWQTPLKENVKVKETTVKDPLFAKVP